jgi:ssDNA-binding Zn-finger/Zn-ribbon topoisomerase 1
MKCDRNTLVERLRKKAHKSECAAKVAALGVDYRGNIIGCISNAPYVSRKGGGLHAEIRLIRRCPKSLARIYIFRVSTNGNPRPIHPCANCAHEAAKRNIRIIPLS